MKVLLVDEDLLPTADVDTALGEVHDLHGVGMHGDGPGHGSRGPVLAAPRQV